MDDDYLVRLKVGVAHEAPRNLDAFGGDAEFSAADSAVSEDLGSDPLRGVARDGEADALGHRNDGGDDAYYVSARI